MSTLHAELLAAHDRDDRTALVTLYRAAAEGADTVDAACFYLTHAYVFALETAHPLTDALYAALREHGRV